MRIAVVLLVLLGCRHEDPASPAPKMHPVPPPAEVSCVDLRHHVDELLEPRYGKDPDKLRKLGHTVTKHCIDDLWSPAVRACIADTPSLDAGHHCLDLLPAEQRTAFDAAMDAAAKDPQPVADLDGLPPNCRLYREAVEKMLACDKVPAETRAAIREAFENSMKSLKDLPREALGAADTACKVGADAIVEAMPCP